MGIPEDWTAKQLVWGEKRNTDWQCLMLVEAKDLCNSFFSHLICFLFILHTHQPGDSSRRTKGSQCCHLCLPTALHLVPEPCAVLVLGGRWLQPDTASLHPAWVTNPPSYLICYPFFSGECAIVQDKEACLRWYLLKQP